MRYARHLSLLLVLTVALTAGEFGCTPTQQGAGIGAGTGAAAGALFDHRHATRGALIGGVAGGLIGGAIGYSYEFTRFCPTCGRRYHYSKQFCPYDGTALMERR